MLKIPWALLFWTQASVEQPSRQPPGIIAADQKNISIDATQTIYDFTCGPVNATLTFTSPLLLDDLSLLSRPVSYITYSVKATDNRSHDVQLYLGASTAIATNTSTQEVKAQKYATGNLSVLKAGTTAQPMLQKKGDDLRIDWGYMYVAIQKKQNTRQYITDASDAILSFTSGKNNTSNSVEGKNLVLNTVAEIKSVKDKTQEVHFLLGYDDLYSIQYFGKDLKPWCNVQNSPSLYFRKYQIMAVKKLMGDSTKKSPCLLIHSLFNPIKIVRADSAASVISVMVA